jgi:cell filamentation protein
MYDAIEDPDCYPGTRTLINKLGIRDPDRLEAFEEEITRERAAEPLPVGRLSVNHFRAVHKHLTGVSSRPGRYFSSAVE